MCELSWTYWACFNSGQDPTDSYGPLGRKPDLERDDPRRLRLTDMIDMRHDLVRPVVLIEWKCFALEWARVFSSQTGRPVSPPRILTELLYLKRAHGPTHAVVIARLLELPVYNTAPARNSLRTLPRLAHPRSRAGEGGSMKCATRDCWPALSDLDWRLALAMSEAVIARAMTW